MNNEKNYEYQCRLLKYVLSYIDVDERVLRYFMIWNDFFERYMHPLLGDEAMSKLDYVENEIVSKFEKRGRDRRSRIAMCLMRTVALVIAESYDEAFADYIIVIEECCKSLNVAMPSIMPNVGEAHD